MCPAWKRESYNKGGLHDQPGGSRLQRDTPKGRKLMVIMENLGLILLNGPGQLTHMGNSVSRDTCPDLSPAKARGNCTWASLEESLDSESSTPSGHEKQTPLSSRSAVAGAATPLQRGSSRLASRSCVRPLFAAQGKQEVEYDPGEGTLSQTRYPKRSRKSVNYAECEVPSEDEFFYCLECGEDRHGDCPVHGPLEFVKDTPVPPGDPQRANKTLPEGLTLARSCIKGAGKGVFTLRPLPARLCYGPYEGVRFTGSGGGNGYTWKVRGRGGYLVDARPLSESNWMRYVNCAPSEKSQNLVAFQHRGGVYYQTRAKIAPGTELLVWYGDEFGAELGLVEAKDGAQNKHVGPLFAVRAFVRPQVRQQGELLPALGALASRPEKSPSQRPPVRAVKVANSGPRKVISLFERRSDGDEMLRSFHGKSLQYFPPVPVLVRPEDAGGGESGGTLVGACPEVHQHRVLRVRLIFGDLPLVLSYSVIDAVCPMYSAPQERGTEYTRPVARGTEGATCFLEHSVFGGVVGEAARRAQLERTRESDFGVEPSGGCFQT
ncbi:histone-lysine N-methyltransferase PRDM9-like isoform X1, partial [Ixodes scapularis]